MKTYAVLCGIALSAPFAALNAADSHSAEEKNLKQLEATWNKEYAAKDLDKLAAHYASDAVLMAPGVPAAVGIDKIRAALKQMIADPALSLKFEATRVEVSKSGDMAYTEGTYHLKATDPATKKVVSDEGSYVTVYKKQADGSWKAVQDIASSENPPAPGK